MADVVKLNDKEFSDDNDDDDDEKKKRKKLKFCNNNSKQQQQQASYSKMEKEIKNDENITITTTLDVAIGSSATPLSSSLNNNDICLGEECQIISLMEWWCNGRTKANNNHNDNFNSPSACKILPMIDVRNPQEYTHRHLHITTSSSQEKDDIHIPVIIHLPFATLKSGERSCELPPRHVEFAILVSPPLLSSNKVVDLVPPQEIVNFFFATKSSATQQSRKPWKVRQIILDVDDNWNDLSTSIADTKVEKDAPFSICIHRENNEEEEEQTNNGGDVNDIHKPLPRLWKPDPLVQNDILHYLKLLLSSLLSPNTTEDKRYQVWDLGSGSGRDLAFLAEELKYFWGEKNKEEKEEGEFPIKFSGFDNHKGSSKRCIPLWKHRGVGDVVESVLLDLNKVRLVHERLLLCINGGNDDYGDCETKIEPSDNDEKKKKNSKDTASHHQSPLSSSSSTTATAENNVICMYAIRYLNRKLLQYITSDECPLEQGTIFAMSHFCKRDVDTIWEFDHPKEKNVLERMELYNLFTKGNQWEVLKNEICLDGDHGRTLIQFVAKRI